MSIFDSIKNALGGGKSGAEPDVTMAPSQVLQNAGIDTSRLDLSFSTSTITVGGEISSEAERDRVLDLLAGLPGIETIEDSMTVAAPRSHPEPDPEPEPQAEPEAPAEPQAEEAESPETGQERGEPPARAPVEIAQIYTVQSGDTLWKIAEEVYGKGSNYMAIFEANEELLENPDRIFPGQELKIPRLD